MSGEVGTSRGSHEQTLLSLRELEQLRLIERRLRRDGLRLEVRDRRADWPYQLVGLAAAAAGASVVALVAASAANPFTDLLFWLGALLILTSALIAVTPIRAAARRATLAGRPLARGRSWFRRRPGG